MDPRIPFLPMHLREDGPAVREAIARVVASGWYVLGPEVEAFEHEFAAASGAAHAVGVGTGTDAIALILRALGIGPGDEVITSPLTAAFTAMAIVMAGARPVFADIDPERLTIDPAAVSAAITPRTRAIVPVHLYGQPADMSALAAIAARASIPLVEDCCQAHLARANGRPVGTIGVAGAFSFYPTKNLGALGDGGAIVTNDGELAARVRRLRNGGQQARYDHRECGVNSRLDEIQAAILRARLPRLADWTERRRVLGRAYRESLDGCPTVGIPPELDPGHVYHLFVVLAHDSDHRTAVRRHLASCGIETLVHYPVALTDQPAFAAGRPSPCPKSVDICGRVLSLPLHPGLAVVDVRDVAAAVRAAR
ncbi:MAG: DegT/DnrJ/EryC1/StrS family aminotransferase [Vicinamibacterales bacterium]